MFKVAMQTIIGQRVLLIRSVALDWKNQYAGTVLGVVWIVLGPILFLTLYAVIYAFIFKVRVPNFTTAQYILNVFAGLLPFLSFSQALSTSASSLQRDKSLLSSTFYPPEFIPMRQVLVSYAMLLVGMPIIVLGSFVFGDYGWKLAAIPIVMFFQVLFSIGVGYFLSISNLLLRDTQHAIQYVVIMLLVVTPIAYTPDMIPSGLKPFMYLNPLFYYVLTYQSIVLLNAWPEPQVMIGGAIISVVLFVWGLSFFTRVKTAINDLV